MTSVSIRIDPANQEVGMKRKILLGLVAGAVALIVETLFALGCFPRQRWCPVECVEPRGLVAFPQKRGRKEGKATYGTNATIS